MTQRLDDQTSLFTVTEYASTFHLITPFDDAKFHRFLDTPASTAVSLSVGKPNSGWVPYILKINVDVLSLDPAGPMDVDGGKFCQFLQHYKESMAKYFSGRKSTESGGMAWSTHVYIRPVRRIDILRYGENSLVPKALFLSIFPKASIFSAAGQASAPGLRAYVDSGLDADDQGVVAAHETGHLLGLKHYMVEEQPLVAWAGSNIMSMGGGNLCELKITKREEINGGQFATILKGVLNQTLLGSTRLDIGSLQNNFVREWFGTKEHWYPKPTDSFPSNLYLLPYLGRVTSDCRWRIRRGTGPSSDPTPTVHIGLAQETGEDLFLGEMVSNATSPTIHEETA